jgi:protein N-terminal amidase
MDINPYRFTAPWSAFEFARTVLSSQSRFACVSMAWLTTLSQEELLANPEESDNATLAYWVERFQPLVEKSAQELKERQEGIGLRTEDGNARYVIFANRCGMEKGVCYAGSSTVLKIADGQVALFDMLGRNEEGLLLVDTDERPKYALLSGEAQ